MSSHATGPRSDAGKERSSLNAVQHGLRSERPVLPGEDADAWDAFCADVVATYAPANTLERELAERIALQLWRLRRAARYEVQVAADECAEALHGMTETVAGLHPDDPAFTCLVEANRELAKHKSDLEASRAAGDVVRRLPAMPAETVVAEDVVWVLVYLLGGTAEGVSTGAATAGELRDLLPDLAGTTLPETLAELAAEVETRGTRAAAGLATAQKRFELLTLGLTRQTLAREHDRRLLQKSPLERLQRYEAHVSRQLEQARKMLREVQAERRAREEEAEPNRSPSESAAPGSFGTGNGGPRTGPAAAGSFGTPPPQPVAAGAGEPHVRSEHRAARPPRLDPELVRSFSATPADDETVAACPCRSPSHPGRQEEQ